MKKKVYLVIYDNVVMFGNFDENGDFYYYDLFRYYNDEHNNKSINKDFFNLLISYNLYHKIEIIDKRHLQY